MPHAEQGPLSEHGAQIVLSDSRKMGFGEAVSDPRNTPEVEQQVGHTEPSSSLSVSVGGLTSCVPNSDTSEII